MDFSIVWAQSALEDLRQIVKYIAADNTEAAKRVGDAIIQSVEKLSGYPRFGRVVPELNDEDFRQIVLSPYRIVYEVSDSARQISILRVWHGARGDVVV